MARIQTNPRIMEQSFASGKYRHAWIGRVRRHALRDGSLGAIRLQRLVKESRFGYNGNDFPENDETDRRERDCARTAVSRLVLAIIGGRYSGGNLTDFCNRDRPRTELIRAAVPVNQGAK
jgi:hypothetical protein